MIIIIIIVVLFMLNHRYWPQGPPRQVRADGRRSVPRQVHLGYTAYVLGQSHKLMHTIAYYDIFNLQ